MGLTDWTGSDPDLACAVISMQRPRGKDVRILVLDGLSTANRPAALGYFILDAMREAFREDREHPAISMRVGAVSSKQIRSKQAEGTALGGHDDGSKLVYVPRAEGGEFGELFRLVSAVERGEPGLLGS